MYHVQALAEHAGSVEPRADAGSAEDHESAQRQFSVPCVRAAWHRQDGHPC